MCVAFARAGLHVCGVHLDRKATLPNAERVASEVRRLGREAHFFNVNAADADRRAETVERMAAVLADRGDAGRLRVLAHSLAFGTLLPFVVEPVKDAITPAQMDMTLDVMAHSLVYWAQDVWRAGLFGDGSKIYAMTSEGSVRVVASYGAVSAAKSALESHCRQLAMEFARNGSGVSVNAIRAGVTVTPALMQIPEAQELIDHATRRNPSGRMTTVDDVAQAIVRLSGEGTHWITGNVIGVDGGELVTG